MSYILDALRKSEQERQRGKVPDLNSFKEEPVIVATKTNIWPWIALAAVVVNLGVVVVLWAPWRPDATSSTLASVPDQQSTPPVVTPQPIVSTPAPVAQPAPKTGLERHAVESPTASAPRVSTAPRPEPGPAAVVVDSRPQVQAEPTRVSPNTPEPEAVEPEAPYSAPPSVSYMPQLEELPDYERQGIPDMTFSSHMYSSVPRFRSIIINGKRLKEGEYFTPELQVREITDKGVIMSNGNTLFSVDILGRWAQ